MTQHDLLAHAVLQALRGMGGLAGRIDTVDDAGPRDVLLVDHDIARGDARPFLALGRPVVLMAPQEERHAIAAYRAQGVAHYLLKPLRRRSLAAQVLAALRGAAPENVAPVHEDDRVGPAEHLGLRVLLAEDNPINALLARTLLQRAGCLVDVVTDGEEAVSATRRTTYDLVFLDLRMPRLDGFAAARQIRSIHRGASGPVLVALTADAGAAERAAALAAGMDDFVTKPIDPERLTSVLARFTFGAGAAIVAE